MRASGGRGDARPAVDLAGVLSEIARALQVETDVETTVTAIVKAAVEHIAGAEDAGVSLVERGGEIRSLAPTSEFVTTIDQLQHRTGEGPCLDVIAHHRIYRVDNLAEEARWSRFTPAATEAGVLSILCYRLFVTESTLGVLNLYSRRPDAFSDQTQQDGLLFATHAAIALAGAQTEAQLSDAVESRDVIGMAKGILMERHDLTAAQAFRMLVESSQQTNLKLHDVAGWLVENRREG